MVLAPISGPTICMLSGERATDSTIVSRKAEICMALNIQTSSNQPDLSAAIGETGLTWVIVLRKRLPDSSLGVNFIGHHGCRSTRFVGK